MHFTLRQLEVFLEVARTENISRAARTLAMSQSAASSALADLERHFNLQLFDRVGKRLQLNELGRLLWPRAQRLLEQARDLELTLAQHREIGELKVGATLTIGDHVAVGLMTRFLREHPGARVTLTVGNTQTIVDALAHFALDVGLIEGEIRHPDLDIAIWREDELVVFCAPEHPYAALSALGDAELTGATWVLREQGSGTRQTFDRAMHGLLHRLDIQLELQQTEAIKRAVAGGLGIGCVSRLALVEEFRSGRLVELATPGRDLRRHFYLALHRHKFRSAGLERWLELCREVSDAAGTGATRG